MVHSIIYHVVAALFVASSSLAQLASGADALGRGNAIVADTVSVWSAAVNPSNATMATKPRAALAASLATSSTEPARAGAVVIVPVSPVVLVATFQSSAVPSYRESIIDLGAAGAITQVITASVRIGFHSHAIERYGSASSFTIDCGARAALFPQFAMGLVVCNITAATVGISHTPLPRDVRFGIAMVPYPLCIITADAVGRIGEAGAMCMGAHLQIHPNISANIGLCSEPSMFSTGIELSISAITACYAFTARPDIGALQTISIGFAMP